MPTQFEKIEAHASHLLDAFIALRERYALLHPMLFDPDVPKLRGTGNQARGFLTLRQSLFLSCAQDVAKLALDTDTRTPSIKRLVASIQADDVQVIFRQRFSEWVLPSTEEDFDPEIVAALRRIELREQDEKRVQFDELLFKTTEDWNALSSDSVLLGFLTIRDKVSAHTEVLLVADKYQFFDIGSLGIKWSDMKRLIDQMQSLVEALGLLIRNAGFAWDMLDAQLAKCGQEFWRPSEG
jgi:hypothetical protein